MALRVLTGFIHSLHEIRHCMPCPEAGPLRPAMWRVKKGRMAKTGKKRGRWRE